MDVNLFLTILGLIVSIVGTIFSIIVFKRAKKIVEILEQRKDIEEYNNSRAYMVNMLDAVINVINNNDFSNNKAISDLYGVVNRLMRFMGIFGRPQQKKLQKAIKRLKEELSKRENEINNRILIDLITTIKSYCTSRKEFYQ